MILLLHLPVSTLHLLAALVAGTAVLYLPKATVGHRRMGWAYVGIMGVVLLTAFGIYTLFGRCKALVHAGIDERQHHARHDKYNDAGCWGER